MDILHFTDCHNNNKLFSFDYGWLTTVSIIFQLYHGSIYLLVKEAGDPVT